MINDIIILNKQQIKFLKFLLTKHQGLGWTGTIDYALKTGKISRARVLLILEAWDKFELDRYPNE
jgi:hypothetical protein